MGRTERIGKGNTRLPSCGKRGKSTQSPRKKEGSGFRKTRVIGQRWEHLSDKDWAYSGMEKKDRATDRGGENQGVQQQPRRYHPGTPSGAKEERGKRGTWAHR